MITVILVTNPLDPARDKVTRTYEGEGDWAGSGLELLVHSFTEDQLGRALSTDDFNALAERMVVSLNGLVRHRADWSALPLKDGDFVVISPVVQGGGVWRTLATIAVIAAGAALTATGAGAALGGMILGSALTGAAATTATAVLAGVATLAGNMLISAFLGPSQPSNKNASASYDPDGPRSLAQSGTVIPKGYGTFRWGGNIIASFTEIAGSDQWINVLVCYGYGPARSISDIQINGKPISEYQNTVAYTRLGTNDQTEIGQFNRISNGYPQQTQCLAGIPVIVPGTGDLTQGLQVDVQFPNGLFVDTDRGNMIPAAISYKVEYSLSGTGNWQPVFTPRQTAAVVQTNPDGSLYFPNRWGVVATDLPARSGVVYHVDNGPHTPGDKWTGQVDVIAFDPDLRSTTYTVTRQGEWQLLDINQNYVYVTQWNEGYIEFDGCQTTPMYNRTEVYGLTPGKYDVRVTKWGSGRLNGAVTFGDNQSPKIGEDMWVHSVNEITYLDLVYPNMILIGVRALATSQLSGQNISVTALIEHGLRSIDEGLMPAALLGFEEDNPALVCADMMVDDLYGGGFGLGVTAKNIERYLDEWLRWAGNNDTLVPDGNGNSIRMCVFNGVFDNESDLWTQTRAVTDMSRACLLPMGLDYGVAVDMAEDGPVQMFHVGNILQDSFQEMWLPIDDRATQVEIQFADSTRYYKQDNPMVYMDPAQQNAGVAIKPVRVSGKGITVPAQAWHHARYRQRATQFLLRTGSIRSDIEGIACRPFNLIALQHDVPQWGQGGRTLPGSNASMLNIDRSDVPFVSGTSYTVMVQHPALQRFTGTVAAVSTSTSPAGVILTCAWENPARVTRAVVAGVDCAILSSNVGNVIVAPPPGFVPAANQPLALFDTDVLESVPVTGILVTGPTATLSLGTPLSRVPEEYSGYIYGVTGSQKFVRATMFKRSSENRAEVGWIDYDARVYDVATPVIGETSAQVTTNPGVTALVGTQIFQQQLGIYASFATLAWKNGPDTVGVGIYAQAQGSKSMPQLVARVPSATSFQVQQPTESTFIYTVVGYDKNNTYAGFTTAPAVTIGAQAIVANLATNSSFANGFGNWATTPRGGDSLQATSGAAVYTVAGTALTGPLTIATQTLDPSTWSAGQSFILSGQVNDTTASSAAPNAGVATLTLLFVDSAGNITDVQATTPLNGTAPAQRTLQTSTATVPAGTVSLQLQIGLAGPGLSLPVGSTVQFSQILLEPATTGQTTASTYTTVNPDLLRGAGPIGRLTGTEGYGTRSLQDAN